MIRIGVDCINWDNSDIGGVNSYITGLLNAFANQNKHEIIIFCSDWNFENINKVFRNENTSVVKIFPQKRNIFLSLVNRIIFRIYPNYKIWVFCISFFARRNKKLIESKCDLLYCPGRILPFYNLSIPTLLSMHDIQQVHFKDFFTSAELKNRLVTYGASAMKATYFQVSSNSIKQELLNYFKKLREDQIVVIPEGVDVDCYSKNIKTINVRQKFNLPEKFLFYPAQLWKHKNHINLLNALQKIKAEKGVEIPLILTGKQYSASEDIFNYIKENNLRFVKYLGVIELDYLIKLYHEAWYLVMPSLYESSSLPILEAAAAGLPIIASKIDSIEEMNQCFEMKLFNPYDVESIAETIYNAWINSEERQPHISQNKANITLNDWSKISDKYLAFIEKVCRN